jgi:spermidine/putrescine transport system permease protein
MKKLSRIYMFLVFAFLYAPIVIMMFFSFNEGQSLAVFSGFSLKWYKELFLDETARTALINTLILAVLSSLISTVIGTFAALGIDRMRSKPLKSSVMMITQLPMVNPDIVTGISLMLVFVFIGRLLTLDSNLNFWTLLIAHVTFNLPYVIMSILPKFKQMDKHLVEAALDLGCTPVQALYKVELPAIAPGIMAGAIMAFTLSIDDFIISNFTSGVDLQTLPMYIYSMTKKTVKPDMYALSTLIFLAVFALLVLNNVMTNGKKEKRI